MERFRRPMTTFYRIPRIAQLNLKLNTNYQIDAYKTNLQNVIIARQYSQKPPSAPGLSGAKIYGSKEGDQQQQASSIEDILEREIQDESAELSGLSTDQFPGFSVETDNSDVLLTKQVGNTTVSVRFTVSTSLNEWPGENKDPEGSSTTLVSMPDFQVQIKKNNKTLEVSCYFEEMEEDDEEEAGEAMDPVFGIDELVMYEGEPKETEFSVSAEYFQDDLQVAFLNYLAEHGIDDEFAKNLVSFATSYEKKQYISLMKRLKNFVA